MTLLAPIAGLTAAVLGSAGLVVFYLLKLRRRTLRVGSVLLWQRAASDLEVNVPFKWLRASWLLLLHLLIIALLALAIARPTITGAGPGGDEVIVLLDRSASMSADLEDGGTRFDAAKERVLEILDRWPGRTPRVTFIGIDARPRVLAAPSDVPAEIRRTLSEIEPSDQPGDLAAALGLAEGLLRAARGESEGAEGAGAPTVLVVGDGGGDVTQRLSLAGGAVSFEPVGDDADNLGVVAVAASRDINEPSRVRVFARVAGSISAPRSVSVQLLVNGRPRLSQTVELPDPTESGSGGAAVFEFDDAGEALATVEIARDDALSSDNRASVVIPAARSARIRVVVPDPEADSNPRVDPFLLDALEAYEPGSLAVVPLSVHDRTTGSADAGGDPGYDLLFFDRVTPAAWPTVPSVSIGGTMPSITGDADAPGGSSRVLTWARSHPLLEFAPLDALVIGRHLDLPGEDDPREAGVELVELANAPDGPVMVELRRAGLRHVVVGFELEQSNWPVQFGFAIFIATAIDTLAVEASGAARAYRTDEPIGLPPGLVVGERRLVGPIERTVIPASSIGAGVRLEPLHLAGLYRLDGVEGAAALIPVNLASDNETRAATSDELVVSGERARPIAALEGRREVWSWCVLGALVLLTLEWMLYAWRSRLT